MRRRERPTPVHPPTTPLALGDGFLPKGERLAKSVPCMSRSWRACCIPKLAPGRGATLRIFRQSGSSKRGPLWGAYPPNVEIMAVMCWVVKLISVYEQCKAETINRYGADHPNAHYAGGTRVILAHVWIIHPCEALDAPLP